MGKVDGTAAVLRDRGYVFLFNPNGRRMEASFTLDSDIGLSQRGKYVLRELHPFAGRLVGKPQTDQAADAGDGVGDDLSEAEHQPGAP